LAIFAMLLQALMPTFSHAGPLKKSTTNRVEICTSSGVQLISLRDDDRSGQTRKQHGDHCPYCFCLDRIPLPVSSDTNDFSSGATDAARFSEPVSNSKATFILAAHPRGPPLKIL